MRRKLLRLGEDVSGVRLKLDELFRAPFVTRELAQSLSGNYYLTDWTQSHANFFRAVAIEKRMMFIQPWQFGHGEVKATCLWLKNLPKLIPTDIVSGRSARVHRASQGTDRWKERSRTLTGIADAMADPLGKR